MQGRPEARGQQDVLQPQCTPEGQMDGSPPLIRTPGEGTKGVMETDTLGCEGGRSVPWGWRHEGGLVTGAVGTTPGERWLRQVATSLLSREGSEHPHEARTCGVSLSYGPWTHGTSECVSYPDRQFWCPGQPCVGPGGGGVHGQQGTGTDPEHPCAVTATCPSGPQS